METKIFLDNPERKKAIGLIHRAYLTQLKNSRNYTASTKTRSEVRWWTQTLKQKGQVMLVQDRVVHLYLLEVEFHLVLNLGLYQKN